LKRSEYAIADLLVKAGANLDFSFGKKSLIYIFADVNEPHGIQYMLDRGADPNISGPNGVTPILQAIKKRNLNIAACLFFAGADVNRASDDGLTPLFEAIDWGNESIITFLISHGADLYRPNSDGEVPLTYAISKGRLEIAEMLVDLGASAQQRNGKGRSALIIALHNKQYDFSKWLILQGAHIEISDLTLWFFDENINTIEQSDPELYNLIMDQIDREIKNLALLANIPAEKREYFGRAVRELADRLVAQCDLVQQGGINRLPESAPELYANRANRKENPEQFILRVYGDPANTGMSQSDIKRFDPQLYDRYRNWKSLNATSLYLPTRREVTDRKLAQFSHDQLNLDRSRLDPIALDTLRVRDALALRRARANREKIQKT
jgi:hypothetical protein